MRVADQATHLVKVRRNPLQITLRESEETPVQSTLRRPQDSEAAVHLLDHAILEVLVLPEPAGLRQEVHEAGAYAGKEIAVRRLDPATEVQEFLDETLLQGVMALVQTVPNLVVLANGKQAFCP